MNRNITVSLGTVTKQLKSGLFETTLGHKIAVRDCEGSKAYLVNGKLKLVDKEDKNDPYADQAKKDAAAIKASKTKTEAGNSKSLLDSNPNDGVKQ